MYKQYNMDQMVLPLDLEMKLDEKDIAYTVHHMVEQIPNEAFSSFVRESGCPAGGVWISSQKRVPSRKII
ncbi:hypothetical protein [Metabacillus sp. 84]|uniref:hypothetical protein n=1 Tax=Metabacillus sp. 84 TaxID=3404705 RepID=UPI003CF46A39